MQQNSYFSLFYFTKITIIREINVIIFQKPLIFSLSVF